MQKKFCLTFLALCLICLAGCGASDESRGSLAGSGRAESSNFEPKLPKDSKMFDGWLIEQTSQLTGKQKLFVCPAACRIQNLEIDVSYLLTPSDWRVYTWSDSRKLVYESSFEQLLQTRTAREEASSDKVEQAETKTAYTAGATGDILGLKAVQYVSTLKQRDEHGAETVTTREMWFSPDIDVPVRYNELQMQPGQGLPDRGLLLRMVVTSEGEKSTVLDTTSARKAILEASNFAVPKGYSIAPSEAAVAMGEEEGAALQDIYENLKPASPDDSTSPGK